MSGRKVWFITGAAAAWASISRRRPSPSAMQSLPPAATRTPWPRPSAKQTICSSSSWTSRAAPRRRRRCGPPSSASAASTCWSTTPPTFMRATSRS